MTIDENGKPTDLKLVRSANAITDQGVLSAVSRYRYTPAQMDGTPVSVPLTLTYNIQ
jgi:TonB family protein